jgi:hypothetical protein
MPVAGCFHIHRLSTTLEIEEILSGAGAAGATPVKNA